MGNISVVIPTIGRPLYLDLALESILSQTIPFNEIIVFDNSKDKQVQKTSKYYNNNTIKWFVANEQLDPINSWNFAINKCTSEFVTICGDDDIFSPNFHENILYYLNKNKMICLPYNTIDAKGYKTGKSLMKNREITALEFRDLRMKIQIAVPIPGVVFKLDWFQKVGGFVDSGLPNKLHSDDLLWFKISHVAEGVIFIKDRLWSYRIHPAQIGLNFSTIVFLKNVRAYFKKIETELINIGVSYNQIYKVDYSKNQAIWDISIFRYSQQLRNKKKIDLSLFGFMLKFAININPIITLKRLKTLILLNKN